MIFGIGTDIIEVHRVKRSIEKTDAFEKKIFTEKEIEYCRSNKKSEQSFAARFAGKEAFFKALGTGWIDGMKFTDIEILNDELGKPYVNIYGEVLNKCNENNIGNIHISLSHLKEFASAYVVLEKRSSYDIG